MFGKVNFVRRFEIEDIDEYRIDFYPDEGDPCYDEQHIFVPIIPEGVEYPGEMVPIVPGAPHYIAVDVADYRAWKDSFLQEERVNPQICQFVRVTRGTLRPIMQEIIREYMPRLRRAGTNMSDIALQHGLQAHLNRLGVSRQHMKGRSIPQELATDIHHPLTGMIVKEQG